MPTPNPLKQRALELGLDIIESLEDLHAFVANRPDIIPAPLLGVAVAYGKLLKTADLALFKQGWVNLHFSLLPAYRGASPVQSAILNGENTTGVTVFRIQEGLDDGPIILQEKCKIPPNATSDELFDQISPFGANILTQSVSQIADGTATWTSQPTDSALITHTKKLLKANARIDWTKEPQQIAQHINAYSSNPGAWFELAQPTVTENLRVVAIKARVASEPSEANAPNGTELLQVKPAGKNVMPAADWLRGLRGDYSIL